MSQLRQLQTYRQNQMETADPGTILIRLYDGAIDFAGRALNCIEDEDVVNKGVYIGKTVNIITEFLVSLDFQKGGEIARNLESLYVFMLDQLTLANVNNDPKPLEVVVSLLDTLKSGWQDAIATERKRIAQGNA